MSEFPKGGIQEVKESSICIGEVNFLSWLHERVFELDLLSVRYEDLSYIDTRI
jgi:hypothetical protein